MFGEVGVPRRAGSVELTLNGVERSVPSRCSIRDLLRHLGLDEDAVAVERNREIVKRPLWPGTVLESGDRIEVVQFVGGG